MLEKNKDVEPVVLERHYDTVLEASFAVICFADISQQTPRCKSTLLIVEPSSGGRIVWEEPGRDESNTNCGNTFNDKQPSLGLLASGHDSFIKKASTYPTSDSMSSVEILQHCVGNHSTKHVCERVASIEPGDAAGKFGSRVPRGHEKDSSGEKGRFGESCIVKS